VSVVQDDDQFREELLKCLSTVWSGSVELGVMFTCKFCGVSTNATCDYVQHFRLHSNVPKAPFLCCFTNCSRTCTTYVDLRKYVSRDHSNTRIAQSSYRFPEVGLTLCCM
jgi:hypothetical protein